MGLWSLLVEMEKNRRKSKRTGFYCSKLPKNRRKSKIRRRSKNRRKSKRTGFLLLKIAATT